MPIICALCIALARSKCICEVDRLERERLRLEAERVAHRLGIPSYDPGLISLYGSP